MRRLYASTLSGLLVMSVLFVMLFFTHQVKQRLDEMHKFHRLQDYMGELKSVSESIDLLEQSEDALEQDISLLKEIMRVAFDSSNEPPLEKPVARPLLTPS